MHTEFGMHADYTKLLWITNATSVGDRLIKILMNSGWPEREFRIIDHKILGWMWLYMFPSLGTLYKRERN